jgi:hypothetical protein
MAETNKTQDNNIKLKHKIIASVAVLFFGILMGVSSKALDESAFNELPAIMQKLDITNFLGRFGIWIFIGVCISVYSSSAKRAALNVFLFFLGMVSSYYIYCALVAGFFPMNYAMIWFGLTLVSPFLGAVCHLAKYESKIAIGISGIIIGAVLSQTILLLHGIMIPHITEVMVLIATLFVLRRKPKEFAAEVSLSLPVAILIQIVFPYWG